MINRLKQELLEYSYYGSQREVKREGRASDAKTFRRNQQPITTNINKPPVIVFPKPPRKSDRFWEKATKFGTDKGKVKVKTVASSTPVPGKKKKIEKPASEPLKMQDE